MTTLNAQDLVLPTSSQGPLFPQGGQLDWVSLLRTSFAYPLEVLARLQNADVHPGTLAIGSYLCSTFNFPAEGQNELTSSLSLLRRTSSVSKVLWFGFGLKHFVNLLIGSEQGAFLAAISAALTISYGSSGGALVLKELCAAHGTPQRITPSIQQWRTLLEACAGSLTRSHFADRFEIFTRLLSPQQRLNKRPADPANVAKALIALAHMSRDPSFIATMVGGLDCAWLAAVAHCLLRLEIEIRDRDGKRSFRSQHSGVVSTAQVTFVSDAESDETAFRGSLSHRVIYISSGKELLRETINFTNPPYLGPSRWSAILSDTFAEWGMFSKPSVAKPFGQVLNLVAVQAQRYYSAESVGHWEIPSWLLWNQRDCLYHPHCTGQDLLNFSYLLLPELDRLTKDSSPVPSEISSEINKCFVDISQFCKCPTCPGSARKNSGAECAQSSCLGQIVMTVIRYILILAPVTIDKKLSPSVAALRQLYACTPRNETYISRRSIPCHGLPLILFLFTGRLPQTPSELEVSAASFGGICVFYTFLRDNHLLPAEAMTVEVIAGHIQHREHTYQYINDLNSSVLSSNEYLTLQTIKTEPKLKAPELVVEETESPGTLAASFRLSDFDNKWTFFGVHATVNALNRLVRVVCGKDQHETPRLSANSPLSIRSMSPEKRQTSTTPEPHKGRCSNDHELWSILAWKSWIPDVTQSGLKTRLNISVYNLALELLYPVMLQLAEWNSDGSNRHCPSRLAVVPRNDCHRDHIRFVYSRVEGSSEPPQDLAQDGMLVTVEEHCFDPKMEKRETRFELTRARKLTVPRSSTKRPWPF